jgi:hypothetical protein
MIVYLSGRYSGEIDRNINAARDVAVKLWDMGYTVFTPHLNTYHFEMDCKAKYEDYIAGDLEILARCDAMVLLDGWQESVGAKIEKEFAEKVKIPIYKYPNIPSLPLKMTTAQEQHLSVTIGKFIQAVVPKYRAGQKEHGGNLWDKPNLPFLLEEVSDFVVYAYTLQEQIERACGYILEDQEALSILTMGNRDGKILTD